MHDYNPTAEKRTDTELDERDAKALTEYMTVLDEGGDVFSVTTQSGREYRVDARESRCTCPDHQHRDARCKHLRRVAFATGERSIPGWADTDAVDPQLGAHVEADPKVVATDGGSAVWTERADALDDGTEILDDSSADPWKGPFSEYDKYGEPTGASYVRCRDCGVEAVTSIDTKLVDHRNGCRFSEGGR